MATRIIIGFLVGLLAVVLVHQPIVWTLIKSGMITAPPNQPQPMAYNMNSFGGAPTGVVNLFRTFGFNGFPILFNQMFWGGIWGIAYGLLFSRVPGPTILKGLAMAAVMLIGVNWVLLPMIRNQPLFAGMVPARMLVGAIINTGFCLGTAFLYRAFRRPG